MLSRSLFLIFHLNFFVAELVLTLVSFFRSLDSLSGVGGGRWVAFDNCNCNYILFTKLPWPGDSEGTFRSSSQAATCPPVYHTRRRLHTVPFNAERQAGKL